MTGREGITSLTWGFGCRRGCCCVHSPLFLFGPGVFGQGISRNWVDGVRRCDRHSMDRRSRDRRPGSSG